MAAANIFGILGLDDLDIYDWALHAGSEAADLYYRKYDSGRETRSKLRELLHDGQLPTDIPHISEEQRIYDMTQVQNILQSIRTYMLASGMEKQYALWQIGFASRMICFIADTNNSHDELQALIYRSLCAVNADCPGMEIDVDGLVAQLMDRAQIRPGSFWIPVRSIMVRLFNPFVVLSVSACADDQEWIDTDVVLSEKLRDAGRRYIVEHMADCKLNDLRDGILDFEPAIIHFCGHGDEEALSFRDAIGNDQGVESVHLATLLSDARHLGLTVVLLSTCYSAHIAKSIADVVGWAVGFECSILGEDGEKFTGYFYGALAEGKSVPEAFAEAEKQDYSEDMGMQLYQGDHVPRLR